MPKLKIARIARGMGVQFGPPTPRRFFAATGLDAGELHPLHPRAVVQSSRLRAATTTEDDGRPLDRV
jgi:hypothetical protein